MNFTSDDLNNQEELMAKMTTWANILMNNRALKAKDKLFRIAEVEFYLSSSQGVNKDGVTHRQSRQLRKNHWYVHRSFGSEKLKPINRIGMDLTCGDQSTGLYGGILIRAIQECGPYPENQIYIYGPALVVRALIGSELTDKFALDLIEDYPVDQNEIVTLVEHQFDTERVYNCPRVLGKSAPKEDSLKPYRFFIWGTKEHSGKESTIFPYLIENKVDVDFKKEFGRNIK